MPRRRPGTRARCLPFQEEASCDRPCSSDRECGRHARRFRRRARSPPWCLPENWTCRYPGYTPRNLERVSPFRPVPPLHVSHRKPLILAPSRRPRRLEAVRARETDKTGIPWRPALFGLDARELDHLRPLFGGLRDDRPEFRGRAPEHCAAQLDDPGFDFGIGEAGIELLVQHDR